MTPALTPASTRMRRRGAAGFILAAALWAIAALALAGAYVSRAVEDDIEAARALKQALQDDLHRRGTEATLLYLLATGRVSHRGLVLETPQRFADSPRRPVPGRGDGELKYSGEVYAGLGRMRFAIQEESGLVSVNAPRDLKFDATLRQAGIAARQRRWIVPRVQDYTDLDHALRLDGAERYDYERLGAPPPANWRMVSPVELRKVLGVAALLPPERWRALRRLLTIRGATGYNFNTMHPEVLASLLHVDAEAVAALLDAREEAPIAWLSEVAALTGAYPAIDPALVVPRPTPYLRISIWPEGAGMRTVTGVTLTPGARVTPWRKEYRYSDFVDNAKAPHRAPATALF